MAQVINQGVQNRLHVNPSFPGVAADISLIYPLFTFTIASPAPKFFLDAWRSNDFGELELAFRWAHDPEGVLLAEGATSLNCPVPQETYDPSKTADNLLTEVTALNLTDSEAVLGFVNRRGLLGLAASDPAWPQPWPFCDSLRLTRDELARIKKLAGWLKAIKNRSTRGPEVPSGEEVAEIIRRIPVDLPKTPLGKHWLAYANELNRALWERPVRALLLPDESGVRQYIRPRTLVDVLYLTLWRNATNGETRYRACAGCGGLFLVSVSNEKKRFCQLACKNRTNVKRHRRMIKRKRGMERGGQEGKEVPAALVSPTGMCSLP